MSVLNENQKMGASGAGGEFEIEQSLRLNINSPKWIKRTPSSDSNRKTWTLSMWHKRGDVKRNLTEMLFKGGGSGGSGIIAMHLTNSSYAAEDKIWLSFDGATGANPVTNRVFRDPSGWMHIVLRFDTTQSTVTDRARLYINGELIISTDYTFLWSTSWAGITQNSDWNVNKSGIEHSFGAHQTNQPLDGYLAGIAFVDGQSLGPDSFGETGDYGEWKPINVSGLTFGTNGYHLDFADSSAMGNDANGSNNFTTVGIAATDQMVDSPTNNFCTFNPIDKRGSGATLSEGNLKFKNNSGTSTRATIASQVDGKIYFEVYNPTLVSNTNVHHMGLASMDVNINNATSTENGLGGGAVVYTYANASGGNVSAGQNGSAVGSSVTIPNAIAAGDIIAFASDSSTGKVWMSINNSWLKNNGQFDGSNALSSSNYLFQLNAGYELTPYTMPVGNYVGVLNCGQDSSFAGGKTPQGNSDSNDIGDFYYAPPTGFLALCTANLPEPDVIPSDNFNPVLYTGNGSTQSITGVGFQPDFVWWKSRSGSNSHVQNDSVRGVELMLRSNLTNAESSGDLTAFQSDGFSVRNTVDNGNYNNETYASWNWKAGGATPSKTYAVTVVSDSGNKYRLDGFGTSAVTLNLQEGGTYTFNYPSAHPFRFSTTANGTHGGGSEYTTGVTHVSSTQTKIVVAASAPALYYYCSVHSGMGGAVNTNAAFGSSNFSGSTISTVSTNVAAGFSIVTYTGTGSNATVGHGLSQKPSMSFIKPRNFADNWIVTYDAVDGSDDQIYLNLTNAGASPAAQYAVAQNATTLGLTGWNNVNDANDTYVAYCFHSVESYSKVGSYVGNGNVDGPMVNLGFKPKFVIIKRATEVGVWFMFDTERSPHNVMNTKLNANSSDAEDSDTSWNIDFLSNGFKLRGNHVYINSQNNSHIFIAFAENPFKHTNAR